MQTNNIKQEYLSRKYTLTQEALLAVIFIMIFIDKGVHYEWGAVLVAILGQYAYFNTVESKTQLKMQELKANVKPTVTVPTDKEVPHTND